MQNRQPKIKVNKTLITAFDAAMTKYKHHRKRPLAKRANGTSNGIIRRDLFTLFNNSAEEQLRRKLLKPTKNKMGNVNALKKYLKETGTLWNSSNKYKFGNYLLIELRRRDFALFEKIILDVYKVKFLDYDSPVTLYRRDDRSSKFIFNNGFELLPHANLRQCRKSHYSKVITDQKGVSTSRVIPPRVYSKKKRHCYYVIQLPAHHHLLFADIVNSPKNKDLLDNQRRSLREINLFDECIPPQYIMAKVKECEFEIKNKKAEINNKTLHIHRNRDPVDDHCMKIIRNENYDPTYKVNNRPRGCY